MGLPDGTSAGSAEPKRETLALKETLEAATARSGTRFVSEEQIDAMKWLRENAPELAALCLGWGDWTRDFLMGDNIDPGDRADLTALLARLDQLGKEQT